MSVKRILKRVVDAVMGARGDLLYWRFRHFTDRKWAESYLSDGSLSHPSRRLLVEAVSKYAPFSSLLEVGCSSGPNLFLLSQRFPQAAFTGLDISRSAVDNGNKWLRGKGVDNVELRCGDFYSLGSVPSGSVDIVISDAVLIYAAPQELGRILADMARIARKAVVLLEQHTDGEVFNDSQWIHNYRTLWKDAVFTKVPESVWGGNWGKYGYVIERTMPVAGKNI